MEIRTKINQLILLSSVSLILCQCNGFNWHHEMNIKDCNKGDISVLQDFIDNSNTSINLEMDTNFNNKVDPLELGWQLWENGRLVHLICNDVPSPFYLYNYDCSLSGEIPNTINKLDALVKLHIQNNDLLGTIPASICDINLSTKSHYWFKIDNNKFCPPYPDCIQVQNTKQNIHKCN